jgi:hypothetical protein
MHLTIGLIKSLRKIACFLNRIFNALDIRNLMFRAFFQATLLELSLSITTPSFVDIIVFNLLIELDKLLICFSKRISKYAATAIAKPLFTTRLIKFVTSIVHSPPLSGYMNIHK